MEVLSFFLIRKNCWGESHFYLIKGLKCHTFDLMLVVFHFAQRRNRRCRSPVFPFVYHRSEIIAERKAAAFIDPLFPAFCEEINVC